MRLTRCGTLPLDAKGNFGENSPARGLLTSLPRRTLVPGPSGESFYGALVMSVPPAMSRRIQTHMNILTMPYPHARCGMRTFTSRISISMEALS
ncbi:hypothetical protein [Shinella sp. M31]|jgi:hypothetical protein|uniref:hypothetical protein n=1 Tax=Shinella sp. M31 TaxID=3368615 RepID=UPI0028D0E4E9|nr:hypothetical protein [uncultured Shinella sp.]